MTAPAHSPALTAAPDCAVITVSSSRARGLSRQLCGVRGRTLILALPGSPGGCADSLDSVWLALPHALGLLGQST